MGVTMNNFSKIMSALDSYIESHPKGQKPTLDLLEDRVSEPKLQVLSEVLEHRLNEFGIIGRVVGVKTGPVVTRYEVRLGDGVRMASVRAVADDISMALNGRVRIQAPIPGTSLVGFETLNDTPAVTGLRKVISVISDQKIPLAVGVDTVGEPVVLDLADMPHLLIAGRTGSGKSVCLNAFILSILFSKTPDEVKIALVDPKRVEMSFYRNLPHLYQPVVTEAGRAVQLFKGLIGEMDSRYWTFEHTRVRNIESFNARGEKKLPYIVVIVDEMADLMMTAGKALEPLIVRLAQLGRAAGIHLVLATQKPVVQVMTGLIKGNIPSRIAFQVSSKTDSRVILDCNGAEKLAGRGDMLVLAGNDEPVRCHGAWVSDVEIQRVVERVR